MLTILVAPLAGLLPVAAVNPPPAGAPPAPGAEVVPAPPAPLFAPGMMVVDQAGAPVGTVQSLAESSEGPRVVVEVDGKLVAVPQSTLRREGDQVVSQRTKADILRRIPAP